MYLPTISCGRIRNRSSRIAGDDRLRHVVGLEHPIGEQRGRADRVLSSASSSIGVRTPCGHRQETLMPASP